jgi:hypothetical protein
MLRTRPFIRMDNGTLSYLMTYHGEPLLGAYPNLCPIPANELVANSNLKQNPG